MAEKIEKFDSDVDTFFASSKKTTKNNPRKTSIRKSAEIIKDGFVSTSKFLVAAGQHTGKPEIIQDGIIIAQASESKLPRELARALDKNTRWIAFIERAEVASPWLAVTIAAAPFVLAIVANHLPDHIKARLNSVPQEDDS